jgi:inner membrane protein
VTLMIASNLPDVDAIALFATEIPAVAIRRGWTHGVLAQAILPVMLAGVMFAIGRRRRDAASATVDFKALLLLSCIGVVLHVGMDLLNNYGVRLLMPFSQRWFYGDSVFIIDLWLWLMLGGGVWLARSRDERAARIALMAAAAYVGALVVSAEAARTFVADEWRSLHGSAPRALMVGPVPLTPFRRAVIVDAGDSYATGTWTWLPPQVTFTERVAKNADHPLVRQAIADNARFRAVLIWARFPYYEIERTDSADVVTLRDMRFGDRVGAVTISFRRQVTESGRGGAGAAASRGSSCRADPPQSFRPSPHRWTSPFRSSWAVLRTADR